MNKRLSKSLLAFADLMLLIGAFLFAIWLKPASRSYLYNYAGAFSVFAIVWLIISLFLDKYEIKRPRFNRIVRIAKANLYVLAFAAVYVLGFKQFYPSRQVAFTTITVLTLLEMLFFCIFPSVNTKQKLSKNINHFSLGMHLDIRTIDLLLLDTLIISISFLFLSWIKPATLRYVLPTSILPMTAYIIVWLVVSYATQKYYLHTKAKYHEVFKSLAYSNVLGIIFNSILFFLIDKGDYSRLLFFGTFLLTWGAELILGWMLYWGREFNRINPSLASGKLISDLEEPVIEALDKMPELEPDQVYRPDFAKPLANNIRPKVQKVLAKHPELAKFIEQTIDLQCFEPEQPILQTTNPFNLSSYDEECCSLLVNLENLNNARRINQYLIIVNKLLKNNGVFIGCGETLRQRRARINRKFTKFLGWFIMIGDFVFNRVFPKLAFTKGLYFALTKGKNRPLSLTEILGRLFFTGFSVLSYKEIEGRLYFAVCKVKEPSSDISPSYGPFIRLKRFGKNGEMINIYKFRTMHPYSEYLHAYMVKHCGFGEKGKVDNDFRVTDWGKFLRKYWLDELPQLFNLAKGDLGIVGVRPLSKRFMQEYPEELRNLRLRFKPGCLPPYVAYRKQKVDEYIDAERIYFEQKAKHPFWTDVKVFFLVIYNILSGKIRSE